MTQEILSTVCEDLKKCLYLGKGCETLILKICLVGVFDLPVL